MNEKRSNRIRIAFMQIRKGEDLGLYTNKQLSYIYTLRHLFFDQNDVTESQENWIMYYANIYLKKSLSASEYVQALYPIFPN